MTSPRIWSLWEIMRDVPVGRLFNGIMRLTDIHNVFWSAYQSGEGTAYAVENYQEWRDNLETLASDLREVESGGATLASADGAVIAINRATVEGPRASWTHMDAGRVANHVGDLIKRATAEMEGKHFLELSVRDGDLLRTSEPLFGNELDEAFPDASDDLREAGRCLALNRYTAVVYHLMRAAEVAGHQISHRLGGATLKDNGEALTFGALIREARSKIEQIPNLPMRDRWLELTKYMAEINRATRTKVAHPGRFYTEETAREILQQTKGLMREAEELLRTALPH